MKNRIITKANYKLHKIENYRFKVLSDLQNLGQTIEISQDQPQIQENFTDEAVLDSEITQNIEQNTSQNISPVAMSNYQNEEMLKKIEQLSENVVKLQMQIESSEEEFKKRLESEIATAKENAYNEGKLNAKQEYENALLELDEKLLKSVKKLDEKVKEFDEFSHKIEGEIHSCAVEIAKQVIAKELEQNSENIALSLSRELMKDIKKDTKIKISVNPKDYSKISNAYQEQNIQIIQDDAVNIGCVVVLSDELNVDGSIENRLEKIKNIILKA